MMSSTPGIGLELTVENFKPENASFDWKASEGHFLSWNPPDFRVTELGRTVSNHGEKLYWSFTEKSSSAKPIIIAVTASDESGHFLDRATVTLAWDGDYAVTVKEIK